MGNITNFLANGALSSIKSVVQAANDALQSFSLNDIGKAMDEAQNRLKDEFSRFMGQIKNFQDKYTVDVPFNPENQSISYSIDGNTICISVKSTRGGASNLNQVVELPEDVNPQEMIHSYDSERHIMSFKFKKLN